MSKDNTNTGGPAFAQQLECNRDGYAVTGGMTLRDYFAAKALQALMARDFVEGLEYSGFCKEAYRMADKMLKEREQ